MVSTYVSMTQLLSHTIAHFTWPSFMHNGNNQLYKILFGLTFIWLNNVKNCKFLIYASMFLVMKINKKSCNPLPFKCWRIIRMVPCNSCPVCLSDNLIRFIGLNNVRIFSITQSWEGIFPSCKLSIKNN